MSKTVSKQEFVAALKGAPDYALERAYQAYAKSRSLKNRERLQDAYQALLDKMPKGERTGDYGVEWGMLLDNYCPNVDSVFPGEEQDRLHLNLCKEAKIPARYRQYVEFRLVMGDYYNMGGLFLDKPYDEDNVTAGDVYSAIMLYRVVTEELYQDAIFNSDGVSRWFTLDRLEESISEWDDEEQAWITRDCIDTYLCNDKSQKSLHDAYEHFCDLESIYNNGVLKDYPVALEAARAYLKELGYKKPRAKAKAKKKVRVTRAKK